MMRPLPRDDNSTALQGVFSTVTSGVQTVVTAGIPIQLITSSTECKRIDVVASSGNGGICYIGGSNTLASTQTGVPLTPLGSYTFFISDVSKMYVDSTVSGDKVNFVYYD